MLTLLAQFDGANLRVSTRRATMLHRNILAVHAARLALYERAFPSLPAYLADWDTSALLALQNSLPDVALGRKPDPVTLLAAHRHAWEVSQLDADNPWRELFAIQDPLDRCIAAIQAGTAIDDDNLSRLVLEALANEPHPGKRRAIALAMYAAVHKTRSLQAAVYETLSQAIGDALIPSDQSLYDDDFPRAKYRQVADLCEQLERESTPATKVRDAYALNLLNSLIPEGYGVLTPRKVLDVFQGIWKKLLPTNGGLS
jgi:hypothetical protein